MAEKQLWDWLPLDLFFDLFFYCEDLRDFLNLSRVSRSWRQKLCSDTLWQRISHTLFPQSKYVTSPNWKTLFLCNYLDYSGRFSSGNDLMHLKILQDASLPSRGSFVLVIFIKDKRTNEIVDCKRWTGKFLAKGWAISCRQKFLPTYLELISDLWEEIATSYSGDHIQLQFQETHLMKVTLKNIADDTGEFNTLNAKWELSSKSSKQDFEDLDFASLMKYPRSLFKEERELFEIVNAKRRECENERREQYFERLTNPIKTVLNKLFPPELRILCLPEYCCLLPLIFKIRPNGFLDMCNKLSLIDSECISESSKDFWTDLNRREDEEFPIQRGDTSDQSPRKSLYVFQFTEVENTQSPKRLKIFVQ
jgi:hypothetical protein